jgi:hypothetical protein
MNAARLAARAGITRRHAARIKAALRYAPSDPLWLRTFLRGEAEGPRDVLVGAPHRAGPHVRAFGRAAHAPTVAWLDRISGAIERRSVADLTPASVGYGWPR